MVILLKHMVTRIGTLSYLMSYWTSAGRTILSLNRNVWKLAAHTWAWTPYIQQLKNSLETEKKLLPANYLSIIQVRELKIHTTPITLAIMIFLQFYTATYSSIRLGNTKRDLCVINVIAYQLTWMGS